MGKLVKTVLIMSILAATTAAGVEKKPQRFSVEAVPINGKEAVVDFNFAPSDDGYTIGLRSTAPVTNEGVLNYHKNLGYTDLSLKGDVYASGFNQSSFFVSYNVGVREKSEDGRLSKHTKYKNIKGYDVGYRFKILEHWTP